MGAHRSRATLNLAAGVTVIATSSLSLILVATTLSGH